MDPVSSLIGTVLLAFGTMLLFGAVKNRRVFGADGIVSQALTKGSLTDIDDVPEAFATSGSTSGKAAHRATKTDAAISGIAMVDKTLALDIEARLFVMNEESTRDDLMPLAQLLTLADAKGLSAYTAAIRNYVKELTGESI